MAMHREHPGPQFDVSLPTTQPALPAATLTHPRSVDVTVSEWTADLAGPLLGTGSAHTTVSALGFVDFDARETIHETPGPAVPTHS